MSNKVQNLWGMTKDVNASMRERMTIFRSHIYVNCKIIGLILTGTNQESVINRFQVGNICEVFEALPAHLFETADIKTFDELKLKKCQAFGAVTFAGNIVELSILGDCQSASLYIERIQEGTPRFKVETHSNENEHIGIIHTESLQGFYPLWEIRAQSSAELDKLLAAAITAVGSQAQYGIRL